MTQPQQPYPPPQHPPGHAPDKKKMSCGVMLLIAAGALVFLVAIGGALAIHGVRRYLAASKSAEAKASIGAMMRAADAAHERRLAAGLSPLCGSAIPVPTQVPPGKKYQSAVPDWETGDDANGWKCLKFALSQSQYYQLHYNKDARFKGPIPDAANVIEAAAMGDLDGDSTPSLFAQQGKLSPDGKQLKISTSIYIDNEFE